MAGDNTASKIDPGTATDGTSNGGTGSGGSGGSGASGVNINNTAFQVTKLLADQSGVAAHTDAALQDAWGVVSHEDRFPMAAQNTGVLVLADSTGLPEANKIMLDKGITGIALNSSDKIQIDIGSNCGQAEMIVASEKGKLWAVSSALSTTSGVVVVDRHDVGAQYTGVAIIQQPSGQGQKGSTGNSAARPLILAVDFHNGRVDVFDEHFQLVQSLGQKFTVPNLPKGFAPFGIMATEDRVFLTFAKRTGAGKGEAFDQQVAGPGLGIVAAFDLKANLIWHTSAQELNVPWGMALGDFSLCAHAALLVGNHGTGSASGTCPHTGTCGADANKNGGTITALDPATGKVVGQLKGADQKPIAVAGLWGLSFRAAAQEPHPNGLFVAAGPEDVHGLFAVVEPVAPKSEPVPDP